MPIILSMQHVLTPTPAVAATGGAHSFSQLFIVVILTLLKGKLVRLRQGNTKMDTLSGVFNTSYLLRFNYLISH
ncbi:hypothetical protein Pmar_PMAR028331 [Perkinsus marinus ATCC 50983]|uniref:Uncharacterized protein n=1 Tax=Perkinsus marinus (strain ATCC 50983 / TXsc) TaxID=423536 RepID=C5KSP8_PERM5|nr:hypothetical protein Pmar_PMAR028331 [Perkinsus marinus ATCC 50983]EER12491.1 hypothetical protein Pmar_PMAR028331 [Perkinsus marinus ATCC 50983]|eukprot:XP_002780696.1 hypothetical protein Pmar_PMAR028331 [Perkinsus marinus ATCC 50983]